MSEMRLIQILCDFGEDCEADAGGQWIGSTARIVAKSRGWTTYTVGREVLDFCPEHSGAIGKRRDTE